MTVALWAAFGALAVVHIALLPLDRPRLAGTTKAFLIPFLLTAIVAGGARPGGASSLVFTGLLCGWAGDVLLLREGKRWFLAGLGAFLLGHVAYIAWFVSQGARATVLPVVAALALLTPPLLLIQRHAGAVRVPAALYAGLLYALVVTATWAWQDGWRMGAYATVGATLFLVSDAILALQEFTDWIGRARVPVMATYIPAQVLIALTLLEVSP